VPLSHSSILGAIFARFLTAVNTSSRLVATSPKKMKPLALFLDHELPSGCLIGQCESCSVRIVSSTVRHLHGSEPEDPAICLIYQAVPTSDLVLDV